MTDHSIGAFSALSRISIRMLRHYDEHGLLKPASVDPDTGYRRYSDAQLADALRIRRLRDVGFSVSAIGAVTATDEEDGYRRALILQHEALQHELRATEERIALLHQLLNSKGSTMDAITVTRATLPATTVVSLRGTIPAYDREGLLWQQFMPEMARQNLTPAGPGGAIEHDGEYRESEVDISVWVPVVAGSTASAPLEMFDLRAQEAVVARVVGPYALITEAHARIAEFARAEGLTLAAGGPDAPVEQRNRNRYLSDPGAGSEHVTEVIVPLSAG